MSFVLSGLLMLLKAVGSNSHIKCKTPFLRKTLNIIEWLGLQGTLKIFQFQPPAIGRFANH